MWWLRATVPECLNPGPATPAWDPVHQFPPLSVGENSSAHATGLLGEPARKAYGTHSGQSGMLLALLRKTSSWASWDCMMVNKTGLHLVPLPMLPRGRPGSYPPPPPQGPGRSWHLLIVLEISADQTKDEMSTDTICLLLCSYDATLWTPSITPGYSNTPRAWTWARPCSKQSTNPHSSDSHDNLEGRY